MAGKDAENHDRVMQAAFGGMPAEAYELTDIERKRLKRDLEDAPVRLCCNHRHYGALCPDGKVMCCLCFERFAVDELNVTEGGTLEDVCRDCAAMEAQVV